MKIRKRIFIILTIAWMIIIFLMSSQPAPDSTETSLAVGHAVCTLFVPGYSKMSTDDQLQLAKKIDHPVRKTAHATEYAILAMLIFAAISGMYDNMVRIKHNLISLGFTTAYAVSDEIHQYFVPGRACMLTDVMIDLSGALVGLILVSLVKKRPYKNRCN